MLKVLYDSWCALRPSALVMGVFAFLAACDSIGHKKVHSQSVASVRAKPNVILILADDLGSNDISLNGNPLVRTPNIDNLALFGKRFAHAYSANAVCAPSRAALLTGRHQQRFGFEFNPFVPAYLDNLPKTEEAAEALGTTVLGVSRDSIPDQSQIGIPNEEATIAQRLKGHGYSTALIGKWHLGHAEGMRPADKGFDKFYGFLGGAALFAPEDAEGIVNARLNDNFDKMVWAGVTNRILDDGQVTHPEKHMTDAFADEAVEFIHDHAEDPFFLYLAFNAPHNPLQATREHYERLSHIKDHKTRVYYAMVEQMDDAIGRVMSAVEEAGLSKDTLIIFASDNGGASYTEIPFHNLPFRGWKATFFDGGIVVPLHVYWPGQIQPGEVDLEPVSLLDVVPTILGASGMPLPGDLDGKNLFELNKGLEEEAATRPLFWRAEHYKVVRSGEYKLQITEHPAKIWLFNLHKDPGEHVNIADSHPKIVKQLTEELNEWEATLAQPTWPAIMRRRQYLDGYQDLEGRNMEYVDYPL